MDPSSFIASLWNSFRRGGFEEFSEDIDSSNPVKSNEFVDSLAHWVAKLSYVILIAWTAITIGCAFAAVDVNSHVSQDTPPPEGSHAAIARQVFAQYYPNQYNGTGFVAFSNALDSSVDLGLDPRYLQFDRALEYFAKMGTLEFNRTKVPPLPTVIATPCQLYSSCRATLEVVIPLPSPINKNVSLPPATGLQYLAPGNRSAYITIGYGVPYTSPNTTAFDKDMQNAIANLTADYNLTGLVQTTLFSLPTFLSAISSSSAGDTETMFFIVVPISLGVFALALFSGRLLMIPILTIVVAYALSFAVLDGIAKQTTLNSMAPSVCVFLLLSYSMTYSFFFLSQYRKQLRANKSLSQVPQVVLSKLYTTAGRSVFLSSIIVTLSGVGLLIFSSDLLRSMGYAIIVVVLSTMIVVETLIPAIIASFPVFFSGAIDVWVDKYNPDTIAAAKSSESPLVPPTAATSEEPVATSVEHSSELDKVHRTLIDYVAGYPQRYAFALLCIALCFIPISYAFDGENSNNLEQYMPKSELLDQWTELQNVFGAGKVFTYTLIIDAHTKNWDNTFCTNNQEIVYTMIKELPSMSIQNFAGIAVDGIQAGYLSNGGNYTYIQIMLCYFNPTTPECLYRYLVSEAFYKSLVNPNVTYMNIYVEFDPVSALGVAWYQQAVPLIERLGAKYNYSMYLYGYGADSYDAVSFASEATEEVAYITAAVIFVGVAIAFGSIVLPTLVVVSTFISVGSAFGLANLIYDHNVLSFLKTRSLASQSYSTAWQVPLVSMTICVGLALNLEMIVLIKLFGNRWRMLDSHKAVVHGMAGVGREVSVAALMSLIHFGGLMANSIPAVNQIGLYFFVATVVQAFLLRLLLWLPIMNALGDWLWWPRLYTRTNCTPVTVEEDVEFRPAMIDKEDFRRSVRRSQFTQMRSSRAFAEEGLGYATTDDLPPSQSSSSSANKHHIVVRDSVTPQPSSAAGRAAMSIRDPSTSQGYGAI